MKFAQRGRDILHVANAEGDGDDVAGFVIKWQRKGVTRDELHSGCNIRLGEPISRTTCQKSFIEPFRSRKRQHYSGVFSIGLNLETRDIIFFISNDMFVTPTFLEGLLLVSAISRDFGIVRGVSNHTDSHPEHVVPAPEGTRTYLEIEAFSKSVFNANTARFTAQRAGDPSR